MIEDGREAGIADLMLVSAPPLDNAKGTLEPRFIGFVVLEH
jgi:hypothetical protein